MQINRTDILQSQQINSSKHVNTTQKSFGDVFSKKISSKKDEYIASEIGAYTYATYNSKGIIPGDIKSTETDQYTISGRDGGYLRIENKETKEGFMWKLGENSIQVDAETGQKFLINDLGAGFFNMVAVDSTLENAIKESLGVDELEEKQLENFTVHQDGNTGIYYITANGYESQGGQLILDDNAKQKLDALADKYMEQYPQLLKNKQEAWFYATFEVRGMAKRTNSGIMTISPNSISFKDKYNENSWTSVFDPRDWGNVKSKYDSSSGDLDYSKWLYWDSFFKSNKIAGTLIQADTN